MTKQTRSVEKINAAVVTKAWSLSIGKRFELFKNSYLQCRWLYGILIKDGDYTVVLDGGLPGNKWRRLFPRILWFWPRITDASIWARGDFGAVCTPENFKSLDRQALILIDEVERVSPNRGDLILDLGCNMGRHLVELRRRGYRSLCGVDAMLAALRAFESAEPEAYSQIELHHDLFQRFLSRQIDKRFATLYTHGATIELVHPSFDIIGHMCRVTRDCVVLLINEWCQSYPRMWERELNAHGFDLVRAIRPADGGRLGEDSANLLVFKRRLSARPT